MAQADFAYEAANDSAAVLAVSIYADRAALREQMRDDAIEAGLVLRACAPASAVLEGEVGPLGEVVLFDCPEVSPRATAALVRLDERAALSGAHLVVSTTLAALDEVFACCERSAPQILVDAGQAERIIALGNVMARMTNLRVRELSGDDRLALLRLTEQVGEIASRLEQLGTHGLSPAGGAFRFESPAPAYRGPGETGDERLVRKPRPPLPDPRLVRRIIAHRQMRSKFFDSELFADPAWDILLDLTAARAEHVRVSVTSLCIASGVPPTTALRWISQMTEAGLLERVEDESDRRRAFVALSDSSADAMARYFAELGKRGIQTL